MLISNLEHAEESVLQGWAMHKELPGVTVFVDIQINGCLAARIPAETYRSDLAAIHGSGHHAFFFNPFDYLHARTNKIEVKESSSGTLVANGSRIVVPLAATPQARETARRRSLVQWETETVEPTGARGEWEFLQRLQRAVHFHPGLRILEVGSGPGHLLSLLIHRKKPFSSYLGMDLSRARIESVSQRFGSERVRLLTGDAARFPFSGQFDIVLASAVCHALYPSFLPLLQNVGPALSPGGLIVFDLPIQDDRISTSRAEWQGDTWFRLYSQAEIRRLLTQAGMELLNLEVYSRTVEQHRVFVTALKLPRRPQNFHSKP